MSTHGDREHPFGERHCVQLMNNAQSNFWTKRLEIEERARKIANSIDPKLGSSQRRYYARGFPHAVNNASVDVAQTLGGGYGGLQSLRTATTTRDALEEPFVGTSVEVRNDRPKPKKRPDHELLCPHSNRNEVKLVPQVRRTREVPWGPPTSAMVWPSPAAPGVPPLAVPTDGLPRRVSPSTAASSSGSNRCHRSCHGGRASSSVTGSARSGGVSALGSGESPSTSGGASHLSPPQVQAGFAVVMKKPSSARGPSSSLHSSCGSSTRRCRSARGVAGWRPTQEHMDGAGDLMYSVDAQHGA
mmetsp:Transcript_16524/g.42051  ORF Transcript_16524/g.42051 Transcript_16524/m.42051 type:complete len:301 (+) Transcript_16524:202-1104(+)